MGHWKSNILFILMVFGTLGYTVVERIVDVSFMYDPEFVVLEYGILGELGEFIICFLIALLFAFSILIYLYGWLIIIAILILWIAIYKSVRN